MQTVNQTPVPSNSSVDLIQSTQHHTVQDIKYKVYCIVIILIGYFLYPIIMDSADQVVLAKSTLDELMIQNQSADAQYNNAKSNASFLSLVKNKQPNVISCINDNQCDGLVTSLTSAKSTISRYLMMSKLMSQKMDFDQEIVLSNISEFLLKDRVGNENGSLVAVVFGLPKEIEKKQGLQSVPITMTIEFASKLGFLNFLNNIEHKITLEYPVVYRVTSLDYDIAASDITQVVTIQADIYFYR